MDLAIDVAGGRLAEAGIHLHTLVHQGGGEVRGEAGLDAGSWLTGHLAEPLGDLGALDGQEGAAVELLFEAACDGDEVGPCGHRLS